MIICLKDTIIYPDKKSCAPTEQTYAKYAEEYKFEFDSKGTMWDIDGLDLGPIIKFFKDSAKEMEEYEEMISLKGVIAHPVAKFLYEKGILSKEERSGRQADDVVRADIMERVNAGVGDEFVKCEPFHEIHIPTATRVHHEDMRSFVEAFNKADRNSIVRCDRRTALRVGFLEKGVDWQGGCTISHHTLRFSDAVLFYSPKTEKEYQEDYVKSLLSKCSQEERDIDKRIDEIFETTDKHRLNPGWAGILSFNVPELSTVIGGARHVLKLPKKRYRIKWTNYITRRVVEDSINAWEMNSMLSMHQIQSVPEQKRRYIPRPSFTTFKSEEFAPSGTTPNGYEKSAERLPPRTGPRGACEAKVIRNGKVKPSHKKNETE